MKKGLNIAVALVMFVIGIFISPSIISRADGGDTSLIHACVKDKGGDVKIVSANSTCLSGYSPLHWGITGPQGLQGPKGEQGPPGPSTLPVASFRAIAPDPVPVYSHVPDYTTIGTFDLPAGKWALFVTVNIYVTTNVITSAVSCRIPEISGMEGTYSPGIESGESVFGNRVSLQMQNLSSSSIGGQTLSLQCTVSDGWWIGSVEFQTWGASLMAIQVAP